MSTITFDTHVFFTELKHAGFSEEQAEAITELQKAAVASTLEQARFEFGLDNVATNQSIDARLREMELRIDARFAEVELRIDARFAEVASRSLELENRLIKWVVGIALGQTAIIAALVKLL